MAKISLWCFTSRLFFSREKLYSAKTLQRLNVNLLPMSARKWYTSIFLYLWNIAKHKCHLKDSKPIYFSKFRHSSKVSFTAKILHSFCVLNDGTKYMKNIFSTTKMIPFLNKSGNYYFLLSHNIQFGRWSYFRVLFGSILLCNSHYLKLGIYEQKLHSLFYQASIFGIAKLNFLNAWMFLMRSENQIQ